VDDLGVPPFSIILIWPSGAEELRTAERSMIKLAVEALSAGRLLRLAAAAQGKEH